MDIKIIDSGVKQHDYATASRVKGYIKELNECTGSDLNNDFAVQIITSIIISAFQTGALSKNIEIKQALNEAERENVDLLNKIKVLERRLENGGELSKDDVYRKRSDNYVGD